jgi:hypothetical protein
MKKIIPLFILCAFVSQTNAQTITDTRIIGSWIHSVGKGNLDHFKPGAKFPPATITGPVKVGYGTDKTVTLSPAVQNKMQAILQVFKEAYPKPYKESVCYGVNYIPANVGDKPLAYNIHIGEYGFQYDKLGKIKPINPASQFGNMYEGYGNVYVNYVPDAYRLTDLIGSLNVVEKLSYYGGYKSNKLKPNGEVLMIAPQNNFAAEIKSWKHTNAPSVQFGNEADNYFSIRQLTGYVNKSENKVNYKVANYVVVSANNQLPFIPVSCKDFLILLEENLNEEAEEAKNRFEKYVKPTQDYVNNKVSIDKTNDENFKERKRKYDLLNLIRETFKNQLEQPAILGREQMQLANAGYYHIFNKKDKPTAKEVSDVFITDKKLGYAIYRRDNDFYKNLKEDEVKTITLEWMDIIEVPLNEPFPTAAAKNKEGLLLTDINYRAAMRHKFNWNKLASLLTK